MLQDSYLGFLTVFHSVSCAASILRFKDFNGEVRSKLTDAIYQRFVDEINRVKSEEVCVLSIIRFTQSNIPC